MLVAIYVVVLNMRRLYRDSRVHRYIFKFKFKTKYRNQFSKLNAQDITLLHGYLYTTESMLIPL